MPRTRRTRQGDLLLDGIPVPASLERDALVTALARTADERLIALRKRAIVLLAWTGAFRRSELVGIDVDDLITDSENGLEVILRRSKTNQEGQHESVLIPSRATPRSAPCEP